MPFPPVSEEEATDEEESELLDGSQDVFHTVSEKSLSVGPQADAELIQAVEAMGLLVAEGESRESATSAGELSPLHFVEQPNLPLSRDRLTTDDWSSSSSSTPLVVEKSQDSQSIVIRYLPDSVTSGDQSHHRHDNPALGGDMGENVVSKEDGIFDQYLGQARGQTAPTSSESKHRKQPQVPGDPSLSSSRPSTSGPSPYPPSSSGGGGLPSSTPASKPSSRPASMLSESSIPEGIYSGYARHKDGSLLSVIFQVSRCKVFFCG